MELGEIGSAIGGAALSLGQGIYGLWNAERNFQFQKDMIAKQWQREDTAVQRRAKDLESAGLSKTLAAGSAATSAPMPAAQRQEVDLLSKINAGLDIRAKKEQIDILKAQEEQIKSQTTGINIENKDKQFSVDNQDLRRMKLELDNKMSEAQRGLVLEEIDKVIQETKYLVQRGANVDMDTEIKKIEENVKWRDYQLSVMLNETSKGPATIFGKLTHDLGAGAVGATTGVLNILNNIRNFFSGGK